MNATSLTGCRVLVVEDEIMVAMLVESVLEDEHCSVVGPFGSLGEAMTAASCESLDLAVLDINLGGELVYPVAELLTKRGVPFLLLSGYGDKALPIDRQHWPICGKPFKLNELVAALNRLLGST